MDASFSILVLQIIGTAAFAASGSLVAVRKQMDFLGVLIMGMTVAVGGGIIRDVLIGYAPPAAFRDPIYLGVSALTSLIIFLPPFQKWLAQAPGVNDRLLLVTDAIGLGVFTAAGIQAAYAEAEMTNILLLLFVGVITGVGGGVIRDMFAGEHPYIFIKDFYATAAFIGAACCLLLWDPLGQVGAMLACTCVVVVLRLLATKYHWKLPKAKTYNQ